MASREDQERRIRAAIQKIGQGPRSVLFSDIEWVMTHLESDLGYRVRRTGQNQHYTYVVEDLPPFLVCAHHRGQAQLKFGYVKGFLARMIDLGLF
jgi:hypothetical protein